MNEIKSPPSMPDANSKNQTSRNYRVPHVLPMEYPVMANRFTTAPNSLFKNTYQTGFLSILYSIGHRPLELWEKQIRSGYVKRITDTEIRSLVLELIGANVNTSFITIPISPIQQLGIRLPIVTFVVKNLNRYFMFEIQISDDTGSRRRILCSNFISTPKIRSFTAQLPLRLEDGWNQIALNLSDLTRNIFGTGYKETVRVQVHANIRIRRIYFSDKVYGEDEVPADFKVFVMNMNSNYSSPAATD